MRRHLRNQILSESRAYRLRNHRLIVEDVNDAELTNLSYQLFNAAQNTNDEFECMDYLNQGADPNIRDNRGRTPIMYAALADNPRAIQILLKAGADPTIKNNSGRTALMYAANYRSCQYC